MISTAIIFVVSAFINLFDWKWIKMLSK